MPQIAQPIRFNPRIAALKPSQTMAMSARARELKRLGRPVISLSAGEPDFETPRPIAEAGKRAIDEGFTRYTDNAGMPELLEAIADKLRRDNGLPYEPGQILCSNGAKQSVAQAVMALCRPGDEVLIPAPYWVSYPEMVVLSGASPVIVPTTVGNEYRLTPEQLESALTERTRLLILCSPSNPTGSVYPPAELEALAVVLQAHPEVFVLSDEIYEHIIFDATHTSIASLGGMFERTITVNGFSKAYAMTGWRLGYMAAPVPIIKAAGKLQSQFSSGPSSVTQVAGLAALRMDEEPIRRMVQEFRRRRDFVLSQLQEIPGVKCPTPQGAFYLFPNVASYFGKTAPDGRSIQTSEDLCFYLLEEHDVALVPGEAFGDGDGLRLSYAASIGELRTASERIGDGLRMLAA